MRSDYHSRLEYVSGFAQANRREAKKAWSFAQAKVSQPNASEWSRWSAKSVFAGKNPTQVHDLIEKI
jgi:hypothetical protein